MTRIRIVTMTQSTMIKMVVVRDDVRLKFEKRGGGRQKTQFEIILPIDLTSYCMQDSRTETIPGRKKGRREHEDGKGVKYEGEKTAGDHNGSARRPGDKAATLKLFRVLVEGHHAVPLVDRSKYKAAVHHLQDLGLRVTLIRDIAGHRDTLATTPRKTETRTSLGGSERKTHRLAIQQKGKGLMATVSEGDEGSSHGS
jgi:hypothetical protein